MRQGQPLGALLGYRFERRLQESGKPQFISFFRELAPLVAKKIEQTNEAVEKIAANNVVDGLVLNGLWQTALSSPPDTNTGHLSTLFASLASAPTLADLVSSRAVLESELDAMTDSVDAVSDALMAESVHQAVCGNPVRAATTVEAIAGGEVPPPELDVVATPRSGIALTHRVITLISGTPAVPTGWITPTNPFRAAAEPHLNAWIAKLLGEPSRVRCIVERLDPVSRTVLAFYELRIDQLRLAPLDFLYAAEGAETGQNAEVEQRILYTIARQPHGPPPGSLLRVSPSRKPDWQPTDLSYGEFRELLRAARRLIAGVRGIDGDDLHLPEQATAFSLDITELERRAADAEQSFRQTTLAFQQAIATLNTAALDTIRDLILRAADFGLPGAIPLSAAGDLAADRQTLLAQAKSILQELANRVAQLPPASTLPTPPPESRRDKALARLRIIFGPGFVVLPRFTAVNAAELAQAIGDSSKIQGGDPLAAVTWFQRMARVRDGVARLHAALLYSEALNTGEKLALTLAQLPYAVGDRWVGLPLNPGQSLSGGKLSLAIQSSAPFDVHQPLYGLLIDEWVEVVPSATESTGIALQYDQPNAAPPQTILLAVPPDLQSPWTVWSLQQVLLETLDLARIRAVDPEALGEVGQYLPAAYLAHNGAAGTVSTNFAHNA